MDITAEQVGIGAVALVALNQVGGFARMLLKDRVDEARFKRAKKLGTTNTPPFVPCVHDPDTVRRVQDIDERTAEWDKVVLNGGFACKWKDTAQVADHIRDAKETLTEVQSS